VNLRRDVALVLSGGAVNGVLMELGFLRRVRASDLWPRVGWIFGTSAGALAGTMAALDRLDDLERFLLDLRPEDAFRPNRLWRLPLLGLFEYALPETIAREFGDLTKIAEELGEAERELVVFASDVTETERGSEHNFELAYSSHETAPDEMAQAILASAAISTLVLPLRVGDRIATDGAWTRNFPLGPAYDRPEVGAIVAFRYMPRYPRVSAEQLRRMRRRLERFRRAPPVRALIAELKEADAREQRGEPAHLVDMITRLMRIAVLRGTEIEERRADERDQTVAELRRLREDLGRLLQEHVRAPGDRRRLARAIDERLATAEFPFGHERIVPRVTVRASVGEVSLEPGVRGGGEWTETAKRALIRRGYELTDRELAAAGLAERLAS
jgi:predicted acylesterase/phospholipase RssA